MKCPYCAKEMKAGIIQNLHSDLKWTQGTTQRLFPDANANQNTIMLAKCEFLYGAVVKAYVCEDCQKLILDYGQKDE